MIRKKIGKCTLERKRNNLKSNLAVKSADVGKNPA